VHGNPTLLRKGIARGLALAQRDDLEVVLLGDFCDNGPDVPTLLEYLSAEQWRQEFPSIFLRMILGNHDAACLLALDPSTFNANAAFTHRGLGWFERWHKWFANKGWATSEQYGGAATREAFAANFPPAHHQFLLSLPWFVEVNQYLFVHAGLRLAEEESVESQLAFLRNKDLSDLSRHVYGGGAPGKYGLPDQLTHKGWSRTNDPSWGVVVVTGHNKYADKYGEDCADFEGSHRIGFHSCACAITRNPVLPLHCALLPRHEAMGPKGGGAAARCPVQDYPPPNFSVSYMS
jgi:hypothetical protein